VVQQQFQVAIVEDVLSFEHSPLQPSVTIAFFVELDNCRVGLTILIVLFQAVEDDLAEIKVDVCGTP